MHHEGIEYVIRASLGRNQWTLLISFLDQANGNSTVGKFSGSREEADGAARRKIDNWIKRQRQRERGDNPPQSLVIMPRFWL
jgi:hypothetical protein